MTALDAVGPCEVLARLPGAEPVAERVVVDDEVVTADGGQRAGPAPRCVRAPPAA
jgi:hypothetical protein